MSETLPSIAFSATPSPTALRVAALRALHQTLDVPPVFLDPLAVRILGPGGADLLDAYRATAAESARLRGTLAARTCVAEATVADAVAHGIRQCVVLGAGLDTFAYRHGYPDLSMFEVDQAAPQAWKRGMLHAAGIDEPNDLTFVTADLARDDVLAALTAGGLNPSQPVVFVMLGVVPYVERDAVLEMLRQIATSCARGTEIVFDYTEPFNTAPAPSARPTQR